MIVIGIDPDSKAHGVAFYYDGELVNIDRLKRRELIIEVEEWLSVDYTVLSIENVLANSSTWRAKAGEKAAVSAKKGMAIGKLHQATQELIDDLDGLHIPYKLHKVSSKWKDQQGKKEFERITGWNKRSNEDTRSAAYFGFLEAYRG